MSRADRTPKPAPPSQTPVERRANPAPAAMRTLAAGEITPRARVALLELMGEVDRLRGEADSLRQRVRELEALADTDPLADVYNRRAFMRELSRAMAFADRYGLEASLVYVDLDDFKRINDAHGHAVGDAVLRHVAAFLVAQVRQSDFVGRLGGDEFAVALAHGGRDAAEVKAIALKAALERSPAEYEGAFYPVKATFGAYGFGPGETAEEALARADAAMYARKRDRLEPVTR